MSIPYVTEIDPKYGEVVQVTAGIRRVIANNPGRFTFTGTGTYIVGRGQVAVIDPGPEDDEHVAAILAAVSGEEITHIIAHTRIETTHQRVEPFKLLPEHLSSASEVTPWLLNSPLFSQSRLLGMPSTPPKRR